jgi:hypothetical protein
VYAEQLALWEKQLTVRMGMHMVVVVRVSASVVQVW